MRIYVKISDEMGEKLDHYSTKFGMSKSAFVAYAVGKHINELEYQAQAYQVVGDKLSTIMDDMSKEGMTEYDELSTYENQKEN